MQDAGKEQGRFHRRMPAAFLVYKSSPTLADEYIGKIDRGRPKVFARATSNHLIMTRQGFALISLLLFFSGFSPMAKAEVELSIFTGVALTQDNDLQLQQNGGTDLTFH